jgi:predicted phosphodiesterase
VRYALLSDVHANLPALEAVVARLRDQRVDQTLCLGDAVGYGASPNECCDILRQMSALMVRGNHDHAAVVEGGERWFTPAARECIIWTRDTLTEENRQMLLGLPPFAEVEGAELCHGSLFDPDFYTTTVTEAAHSIRAMQGSLAFFGHTHYAEWFTSHDDADLPVQFPMPYGGVLDLDPARRQFVNPGSVGQPRDGNSQAAYALWDSDEGTVTLERVSYNVRAAQERMHHLGLPHNMASRLLLGV